ncbi:3-oxoadipate enol-lactonase [Falsirhodobacter deserti]|uniref:3-oxoadipate enol-lactonase n=1 Tax=Falsirhodobacter deserti TaxID=1365611 RepID=UPI000FE2C2F3|nr:3-oxoadipate enol-lactonase [Falsirhodobacter deserti]
MQALMRPWGVMHYAASGPEDGPAVVFANSLGTDLRLWDALLPLLPAGLRLIRYDKRGHGLSDAGPDDGIEGLAQDVAALIEHAARGPVVLVGLSIGGLIAQQVAATRPDLLRGLVLSNTAAKLGTAESWQARITAVRENGMAAIAPAVMERWFAPAFLDRPERALWQRMMERTDPDGYVAACRALAAADLTASTRALRLPTIVIGGSADGASPPAVVEATAALIEGASFHMIPDTGHLPPVEAPRAMADILTPFLQRIFHV